MKSVLGISDLALGIELRQSVCLSAMLSPPKWLDRISPNLVVTGSGAGGGRVKDAAILVGSDEDGQDKE